jgi:hypothetical protein
VQTAVKAMEWTHPSARLLAELGDPVDVVIERARQLVFEAVEAGWEGPPFDPLMLAELRGIEVLPRQDVVDARIRAEGAGQLTIAFNPALPRGRRRYSIAHELAHSLFPDVAEQARFRSAETRGTDDWQLELLCNMAAAELLMPIGTMATAIGDELLTIDHLLELRSRYDVSVEAMALRLVHLSRRPLAVFAAARPVPDAPDYRIDYYRTAAPWRGARLPRSRPTKSTVGECTAIGYTAKADELWPELGQVHIECVGIPPYPGHRFPRVVGIVTPPEAPIDTAIPAIKYLTGDATQPRGAEPAIVLQLVNDRTPNWGGGFSLVVRRRWPAAQEAFRSWVREDPDRLAVGSALVTDVAPGIAVASLVATHGYGPSPKPRIRYGALERALESMAEIAAERGAGIHAPRIGAGQAGGSWSVVAGLLEEIVCARGIPVTIYDLPGAAIPPAGRDPAPIAGPWIRMS